MVIAMLLGFGLLAWSMRALPLGAAYMIWPGIGAVGAFIVGVAVLGETLSLAQLAAASLIACGLVLIKLSSPE